MIQVQLTPECAARLLRELSRAGSNEVGGVLATEHVGGEIFRIVDLSVQRKSGSLAAFSRDAKYHKRFMRRFFDLTGHQYERFNYLGEWHSHPSFPALPSSTDLCTMYELLSAPDQPANFLVLVIVKRNFSGKLEGSAHAFVRGRPPLRVPLLVPGYGEVVTAVGASPRMSLRKSLAMRAEGIRPRPSRRQTQIGS